MCQYRKKHSLSSTETIIVTIEELSFVSALIGQRNEPGSDRWSDSVWLTDPLPHVTSVWLDHFQSLEGAKAQSDNLWQAGWIARFAWTGVTSSDMRGLNSSTQQHMDMVLVRVLSMHTMLLK